MYNKNETIKACELCQTLEAQYIYIDIHHHDKQPNKHELKKIYKQFKNK